MVKRRSPKRLSIRSIIPGSWRAKSFKKPLCCHPSPKAEDLLFAFALPFAFAFALPFAFAF
jgi:hypothetical protein